MSSLTIEMGLRRKRGNSPTVPDQIARRDDVTVAQKQRLAMLSKMGLGSVAGAGGGGGPVREAAPMRSLATSAVASGPPLMDRKQALLERERRIRAAEEVQEEDDDGAFQGKPKRARPSVASIGIARLGPVMPREDEIPQFLPMPMQVPAPRPAPQQMEIKISKETAERAKLRAPEPAADDVEEEDEGPSAEDQVLAFLRMSRAQKGQAAPSAPSTQKPKKKRKKARKDDDGEDFAAHAEDEEGGGGGPADEHHVMAEDQPWHMPQMAGRHQQHAGVVADVPPHMRQRDGGVNKSLMVVESVKGKVSTANRNFTDADLERRFSLQEARGGHGALMSEAEALRMIKKEKQEKGGAAVGSATRRVQRELAEWAVAKEQQRARVKSPHRFERMVVARK